MPIWSGSEHMAHVKSETVGAHKRQPNSYSKSFYYQKWREWQAKKKKKSLDKLGEKYRKDGYSFTLKINRRSRKNSYKFNKLKTLHKLSTQTTTPRLTRKTSKQSRGNTKKHYGVNPRGNHSGKGWKPTFWQQELEEPGPKYRQRSDWAQLRTN